MGILTRREWLGAGVGVAVIAAWLVFISTTSRDRAYYLKGMLSPVAPGEVIDFRNDPPRLYLRGWSPAESEFRWSADDRLQVCFKPDRDAYAGGDEIGLALDIVPLPALTGRVIGIRLEPGGQDIAVPVTGGPMQLAIAQPYVIPPGDVCLHIDLPVTVQPGPQDMRRLGIQLLQVTIR